MKITFLSNYYSHHQKPVSRNWDSLTDGDFTFVATEEFSEERKKLGWKDDNEPFILKTSEVSNEIIENVIDDSDVVILGNAPLNMIKKRLNDKKTVFKYSERVFKRGYDIKKWPGRLYTYWKNYGRHKELYLLSAGAYVTADFTMHGTFKGKSYKWGYFPKAYTYDIDELIGKKTSGKILWCGRFLDWKHPEAAIETAKRLKNDGYDFQLEIIGTGEMEDTIKNSILSNNLENHVVLTGAVSPDEVRKRMEEAEIYLFTSDFNEGWGAVLNESMNSGCAVVASHAIGSVPFLLKNNENGFIYKNGDIDDLYQKVKLLLDSHDLRHKFGLNAYKSIVELWNADVAARRFIRLAQEIKKHGTCDLFSDGPCSKAPVIKNNWFK